MVIFIHPLSIYPRRRSPRFYDPFEEFCHPIMASPWNNQLSLIYSTFSSTKMTPDTIKNENGKIEIKCSIPGFLQQPIPKRDQVAKAVAYLRRQSISVEKTNDDLLPGREKI